ncbi:MULTISPECIES: NfeD family protein [Phenylobacterium]|uniref:Membrane protein implicated in regulation of membrane protease activity n=1 Tax=Phenylobacterium koreense TaxID=266125 RepID=A0ABV2EFF2_9CAUL
MMTGLVDFYGVHAFWLWVAIAAAVLAIEIAFGSGWLLWPAACAAVVAILSLFTHNAALEIGLFAVLTIATTLAARRFWPRNRQPETDINDNVARLVGHHGRVTAAFIHGAGRVLVDGKEWAAESVDGSALELEAIVEVVGLSGGSRLRVRAQA